MTSEGDLTTCATPWSKQCRESFKEFGDGDELVSDPRGDLRTLFAELAERLA